MIMDAYFLLGDEVIKMKISYKKDYSGSDPFMFQRGFNVLSNMSMLSEIILKHAWSPIVWKDGIRNTSNFISSDFLVLDFDKPGEESMQEVNWSFQDHKRIIATTRSHGILKNGIICDRYRLIIPFSKTIYQYSDYRYQYAEALKRFPWADKSCLDGARFFFPSKEIICMDRDAEFYWELKDQPLNNFAPEIKAIKEIRKIPPWCLRFINDGVVLSGSRNLTLLGVCYEMFSVGFSESEIRKIVLTSRIDWKGINFEAVLKSAKKKAGMQ